MRGLRTAPETAGFRPGARRHRGGGHRRRRGPLARVTARVNVNVLMVPLFQVMTRVPGEVVSRSLQDGKKGSARRGFRRSSAWPNPAVSQAGKVETPNAPLPNSPVL
ncbi:hypothetical protein GCM10010195_51640 [Kitasatospora griseola]|nr:hypothetical protein GCM10010195_51640 [Kitasatospora griseola]